METPGTIFYVGRGGFQAPSTSLPRSCTQSPQDCAPGTTNKGQV